MLYRILLKSELLCIAFFENMLRLTQPWVRIPNHVAKPCKVAIPQPQSGASRLSGVK
jgi:hypothetical protein